MSFASKMNFARFQCSIFFRSSPFGAQQFFFSGIQVESGMAIALSLACFSMFFPDVAKVIVHFFGRDSSPIKALDLLRLGFLRCCFSFCRCRLPSVPRHMALSKYCKG